MNKPEDLDALLDIYLFSELNDEDALDDFLKANQIDFEIFKEKLEDELVHLRRSDEEGMVGSK